MAREVIPKLPEPEQRIQPTNSDMRREQGMKIH
jgi:hypothetical protein